MKQQQLHYLHISKTFKDAKEVMKNFLELHKDEVNKLSNINRYIILNNTDMHIFGYADSADDAYQYYGLEVKDIYYYGNINPEIISRLVCRKRQ